jgi:5'-nucleotidase
MLTASPGTPKPAAVSIPWSDDERHWETAATFAVAAVGWVAEPGDGPRVLNVNVPNVPLDQILGVREAELAPHGEVWIASADVSSGDLKLDLQNRTDGAPHTDVGLVRAGYVSVTPLMSIVRAPIPGAAGAITSALAARP